MKLQSLVGKLALNDTIHMKCRVEFHALGNGCQHVQILAEAVVSASYDVITSNVKDGATRCGQLLSLSRRRCGETLRAHTSTTCEQQDQAGQYQQSFFEASSTHGMRTPPSQRLKLCAWLRVPSPTDKCVPSCILLFLCSLKTDALLFRTPSQLLRISQIFFNAV